MTANATTLSAPLDSGRRFILAAVCVGLVAMLAASFQYRLDNPSLAKQARQNAQAEDQGEHAGEMELVSALMQKVQENPNDAGALTALGQHFLDHSEWAKAEGFLARAVVAAPSDPEPLYMLGMAQYQQQSFAKAGESFERLVELGSHPAARYNLGILYRHYLNAPDKGNAHLKAVMADAEAPAELKQQAKEELESPLHDNGKGKGAESAKEKKQ